MRKFTKICENKIDNQDIKNILIDVYDAGCEVEIIDVFFLNNAIFKDISEVKNSKAARYCKFLNISMNLKDERVDIKGIQEHPTLRNFVNRNPLEFSPDFDKFTEIITAVSNHVDHFEGYEKRFNIYYDHLFVMLIGPTLNQEDMDKADKPVKLGLEFFPKLKTILEQINATIELDQRDNEYVFGNNYSGWKKTFSVIYYLNTGETATGNDLKKSDLDTIKVEMDQMRNFLKENDVRITWRVDEGYGSGRNKIDSYILRLFSI